jgi:hypothetical protein
MGGSLTTGSAGSCDRRRSARVEAATLAGVVRMRLPPGRDAVLLNLSRDGACVEAGSRLLPGRPVEVVMALPGWGWRGRATVTRCRVSALAIGSGVRYEAALQFELPLDPDGPARILEAAQEASLTGYTLPIGTRRQVSARAVTTRHECVRLREDAERC